MEATVTRFVENNQRRAQDTVVSAATSRRTPLKFEMANAVMDFADLHIGQLSGNQQPCGSSRNNALSF
jgi:hypothetical protein